MLTVQYVSQMGFLLNKQKNNQRARGPFLRTTSLFHYLLTYLKEVRNISRFRVDKFHVFFFHQLTYIVDLHLFNRRSYNSQEYTFFACYSCQPSGHPGKDSKRNRLRDWTQRTSAAGSQ